MSSRRGKAIPARGRKHVPESSLSCFYYDPKVKKPASRKKFDPSRRSEVASVRKRGACLRYRLLRIKCDQNDPCSTCLALATKALTIRERKVLQFADCIRTPLKSASIFEHDLPPLTAQADILARARNFTPNITTIYYGSEIQWNEEILINDLAGLFNNFESWRPLRRGPLCSSGFFDLIRTIAEDETTASLQRLIYLHSMIESGFDILNVFQPPELLQLYAIAGHHCLEFLDRKLAVQSLAASSQKELRVLFFLLSSTLSAISFAGPITESASFPRFDESMNGNRDWTLFDAMQEHLCRTITHFIVYLASHLNLPLSRKAEQALLTASPSSWRIMTRAPDEWHKREVEALSASSGSGGSYNYAEPSVEFDGGMAAKGSMHGPGLAQPSLPPLVDYFGVSDCGNVSKSFCIPHSIRPNSPLCFNGMQAVDNVDLGRRMLEPPTSMGTSEMSFTSPSGENLVCNVNGPRPGSIELSQGMETPAVQFEGFEDELNMSEVITSPFPEGLDFSADGPEFTVPRPPPVPTYNVPMLRHRAASTSNSNLDIKLSSIPILGYRALGTNSVAMLGHRPVRVSNPNYAGPAGPISIPIVMNHFPEDWESFSRYLVNDYLVSSRLLRMFDLETELKAQRASVCE